MSLFRQRLCWVSHRRAQLSIFQRQLLHFNALLQFVQIYAHMLISNERCNGILCADYADCSSVNHSCGTCAAWHAFTHTQVYLMHSADVCRWFFRCNSHIIFPLSLVWNVVATVSCSFSKSWVVTHTCNNNFVAAFHCFNGTYTHTHTYTRTNVA